MHLLNANYLGHEQMNDGGWSILTVVEYVGDLGECRLKSVVENELPFKPD